MNPSLDLHVPPDWRDAAARIAHKDVRRVMVVGAADVGKSSLCRFLLGEASARGRTAALLDTDVGQKMIGPAACMTLAEVSSGKLVFVGTIDPVRGWRRVVEGTRVLAQTVDSDLVITNTSGLLAGPGRRLKAEKIAAIRPDLLIAIGGGSDLELIISDHPAVSALRLTRSPAAQRKTPAARRDARQLAFRSYFCGASLRVFLRAFVPEGLQHRLEAGVLVGLADEHETDLGLGILVEEVSPTTLNIVTPVAADGVRQITPGCVRLREDFSEVRCSAA